MLKTLKRRDVIILITFWLTAICTVGIVLIFFLIRATQFSEPVYQLETNDFTALALYPVAQEAAEKWEEDVRFISASATWNNASVAEFEEPIDWVYRFYSPSQQRIIFVIVTSDQRAIVQPHLVRVRRELRVIDPDDWNVDSPVAVEAWLNSGGGEWLQQASSRVVSIQLTFNIERDLPVWTISGFNPETGQQTRFSLGAKVR
ncbi:MAG: hypothetical protein R3264_15065 [Anaerolineae bacterium]|nr:hypothetical protein [Anaerolineae bacterium]